MRIIDKGTIAQACKLRKGRTNKRHSKLGSLGVKPYYFVFFTFVIGLLSLPSASMATTTYLGSQGLAAQVFTPYCTSCHAPGDQFPPLDEYDNAESFIFDIIFRINLPSADLRSMPKNTANLPTVLLNLVDAWHADNKAESAIPELTVSGHSALMPNSATLQGSIKENGIETNAYFKYWSDVSEPTNCPPTNSISEGCTVNITASGSGGDDIAKAISAPANGLNCATTYSYRAVSNHNGRWTAQNSPTTLSFMTNAGPNTDTDSICDAVDNCPADDNDDQFNTDNDSLGNVCDPDDDNDGDLDGADNCPLTANPGQEDSDHDGIGDACDSDNSMCFPIVVNAQGQVAVLCF